MLMTIFGILILVMAIFLVITILMQSSRDHRLSGTIAGGAETFFGKQKGKTMLLLELRYKRRLQPEVTWARAEPGERYGSCLRFSFA